MNKTECVKPSPNKAESSLDHEAELSKVTYTVKLHANNWDETKLAQLSRKKEWWRGGRPR